MMRSLLVLTLFAATLAYAGWEYTPDGTPTRVTCDWGGETVDFGDAGIAGADGGFRGWLSAVVPITPADGGSPSPQLIEACPRHVSNLVHAAHGDWSFDGGQ